MEKRGEEIDKVKREKNRENIENYSWLFTENKIICKV